MHLSENQLSQFGKVAVLMGGESAEREISLESGKAVHAALLNAGVDAHIIDYQKDSFHELMSCFVELLLLHQGRIYKLF